MERPGPISEARNSFARFVREHELPPRVAEPTTSAPLQEWLMRWLEHGDGVEFTGGSYETFLRVALDVADAAIRGELRLDFEGTEAGNYKDGYKRTLSGIHEPDHTAEHIFNRVGFETTVYRREHGL